MEHTVEHGKGRGKIVASHVYMCWGTKTLTDPYGSGWS